MKTILILQIFIFIHSYVLLQYLVPDPGFENYKKCPSGVIQNVKQFPLEHWEIPTLGTSDYFNKCRKKTNVGIPRNQVGFQESRNGNGYVGILRTRKSWFEYIQTPLINKLEKNKSYCVKFYVSLADYSRFSASNLGVYFHNSKLEQLTTKSLSFSPQVYSDIHITDTSKWVKVQGEFKANGRESHMIIGFFKGKKTYKRIKTQNSLPRRRNAYYYIDDVSVVLLKDGENCSCESDKPSNVQETVNEDSLLKIEPFSPGEQITLPDITFKVNKSDLSEKVFPLLDSLANYLEDHSKYKLIIEGHTDKVGSEEHNKKLSLERAQSVKLYLESKGIEEFRIKTFGKGSEDPIADSNSKEGQQKNRRVEIIIVEN